MPRKRRLTVAVAIAASVVLGFLCRNISPLPLRISSGRSPAIEASNTLAASFEIAPLLAASRDGDGPVTQDNFSALDKQKSDVEVYVFLSPHCPISNAYVPLLSHLIDEFSRSNFQFFGVISGAVSDDTDEFRQKFTIRIPLIVDHQNRICELTLPRSLFALDQKRFIQDGLMTALRTSANRDRRPVSRI